MLNADYYISCTDAIIG